MDFLPQIQPWINDLEMQELAKVIESTYITENAATQEFEDRFKELTGAKHALAYANGTVGLFAALLVMGLKEGDEVIVPDLTFIATVNAVLFAGGTPVLCDIKPGTWQLDPSDLESKITEKTKVIVPVHLYGFAADMNAILNVANRHNLLVLEDAAQGVGVELDGRHVGTWGDIGMISFYGNKTMTTGEGAIILTNNDEYAAALYRMKNHGRSQKGVFKHEEIGFNFSFSDLHAAVGIAQLKKLPRILERKREIYDYYHDALADIPDVEFYEIPEGMTTSHWFTNVHVPSAEELENTLRAQSIGSRRYFYPIHAQPCYHGRFGSDHNFPETVHAYQTGLSLPSSVEMNKEEQDRVIAVLREFYSS